MLTFFPQQHITHPTYHPPAGPNDTSKVGYAFPLDDNHPLPGVAHAPATATAAAAAAASHTKRGGNGNKRAAAGSNGSSRRGSPASLGSDGDGSEPQRKRERKSPHDPNQAEVSCCLNVRTRVLRTCLFFFHP